MPEAGADAEAYRPERIATPPAGWVIGSKQRAHFRVIPGTERARPEPGERRAHWHSMI